jgi:hypothetical protein
MPRRKQRRQAPKRSLLAALLIVIPLAAAAAEILGFLELPIRWPWESKAISSYEADLSKPDEATAFWHFLEDRQHKVVRLNLFVPIEQELPDGSMRPIEVDWGKGHIESFSLEVGCTIFEREQICDQLTVKFVAGQE